MFNPASNAMVCKDFPTLADDVVRRLGVFLRDHGIPTIKPLSEWCEKQLQQHDEVVMAWLWTVLYCSRQGSTVVPALTEETLLQRFVTATADVRMSYSVWAGPGVSRPMLDLTMLLLHPPALQAERTTHISSIEYHSWIAEGVSHWKQQDKAYSSNFAPVTDAVINLRSILLILKLISTALSKVDHAGEGYANLIVATLWKVMEKVLTHISLYFDTAPSTRLAARGYNTAKGHANTQQSCQLAAAVVRLMLPLIRSNLKHRGDRVVDYFDVLRCLLQPQWGLPAATAQAQLVKSGMLFPIVAVWHVTDAHFTPTVLMIAYRKLSC